MNAFFNLKIILILTLTLSSNFSYAGLKDKFNEQQKPKTNSIPQEVLDIRDDINNTWDAIRKEGTFYYVMEGDNIENYTTDIGSFWRYKQNFIDDVFPVVRLGNRVLLPLHIPEVNEKGVVWKGKTLSCDTSRIKRYTEVSFARPTPIGKIDKGGTASFKMEYLQSDYHMPKRSSSFSIERDFEVNFDTNECYTLYKSGSVQKCHITTFAEIADYKKSNYINGKNNTERIYNKLYLNNSNLKYCKVQK